MFPELAELMPQILTDERDVKAQEERLKQVIEYRNLVVVAMEKNGATQDEVTLVHDETIINSIQKKRQPEDVAWAILQ